MGDRVLTGVVLLIVAVALVLAFTSGNLQKFLATVGDRIANPNGTKTPLPFIKAFRGVSYGGNAGLK